MGLLIYLNNRKCEKELLILEEDRMKKVFCMLLGFQMVVSGCAGHLSSHCEAASDEIAEPSDVRENYYPILTPVIDVAAECYCYCEDAVIVAFWLAVLALVYGTPNLASLDF